MELNKVAKKLEGLHTLSTIAKNMGVSEGTALNYVWILRKRKYLRTAYGGRKRRIYWISPIRKRREGYSFYELLNQNTRIKLTVREDYIIHSDKKPSVEEILVRCVATRDIRIVLASLDLFNKVKNWSRLKYYADKYNAGKKIGALYDVARKIIRVKKMDKRTRNSLLKGKGGGYIIKGIKSKHFKDIEKKWNVCIPFNQGDLEAYHEWS